MKMWKNSGTAQKFLGKLRENFETNFRGNFGTNFRENLKKIDIVPGNPCRGPFLCSPVIFPWSCSAF